jgi:hypothetical protein
MYSQHRLDRAARPPSLALTHKGGGDASRLARPNFLSIINAIPGVGETGGALSAHLDRLPDSNLAKSEIVIRAKQRKRRQQRRLRQYVVMIVIINNEQ